MALTLGRVALGRPFAFALPFGLGLPLGFGRAVLACCFMPVIDDRAAAPDLTAGLAVRVDRAFEAGLAIPDLAAVVIGRPVVGDAGVRDAVVRDPVVRGLVVRDLVDRDLVDRAAPDRVVADLPALDLVVPAFAALRLAEPAMVLDFAAVLGRAVVRDRPAALGAEADGRAAEAVLTAALSDLAAVVMALVAVFIACRAVDIVLADDVAFVAAAVILLAAEVTLVAAVDTVRAAVADDGEFLADLRVVLTAVARVLDLVFGRRAARLGVLPLVDRVRAGLAGLRRAAVRVVVRAGTDLPPSRSITEVLFHSKPRFTHTVTVAPGEQWPQPDESGR